MGIPEKASEGVYTYGKGNVYVVRQDPKEFVMNERGDATLLKQVEAAYGQLEYKNHFYLERGPYVMAAVLMRMRLAMSRFSSKDITSICSTQNFLAWRW
jgi:hypothetical protein